MGLRVLSFLAGCLIGGMAVMGVLCVKSFFQWLAEAWNESRGLN
jgi:hypothetical protein